MTEERALSFHRKFFDPDAAPKRRSAPPGWSSAEPPRYVYTDEIILAVNVALAAKRPLLVAGNPGTGKSTLARHVAWVKEWRFLKAMITSRTRVDDLLAGFDALRRLNDAHLRDAALLPDAAYVEPGRLWWAFDPQSARWRGMEDGQLTATDRERFVEATDPSEGTGPDAVVLLDEIDKADPDLPNDLLEPLDLGEFSVKYRKAPVAAKGSALVVLTTNGERELPPAFMRRCVVLKLEPLSREWLLRVAERHFGSGDEALYGAAADWLLASQAQADQQGLRPPSTAEFLDTLRAARQFGVRPGEPLWGEIANVALWKHESPLQPPAAAGNPSTEGR